MSYSDKPVSDLAEILFNALYHLHRVPIKSLPPTPFHHLALTFTCSSKIQNVQNPLISTLAFFLCKAVSSRQLSSFLKCKKSIKTFHQFLALQIDCLVENILIERSRKTQARLYTVCSLLGTTNSRKPAKSSISGETYTG